ncbi:MAG: hypothetical protein DWH91_01920 [Planctomycetota bacterium]|nr:MAG: hypothetical protein DWH91_01920 [Planctomycetota bacterium]
MLLLKAAASPNAAKKPALESKSTRDSKRPTWIAGPPSAPLAPPQLPPVVSASPDNRFDRRFITLAALILGAVLLITGVGYTLIAGSDDGKPEVIPETEVPGAPTK